MAKQIDPKARATQRAIRKSLVRKGRRETVYKFTAKRHNGTVPCFVCGRHVKEKNATLEHIVHIADGGTDDMGNLAISHHQCNQRRGSSNMECVGRSYYVKDTQDADCHSSPGLEAPDHAGPTEAAPATGAAPAGDSDSSEGAASGDAGEAGPPF